MTLIKLRKWDMTDAPALVTLANNKKISDNLRDRFPHPYTFENAEEFIRFATTGDSGEEIFAIEVDGNPVGAIGAIFGSDVYRLNAEIGYWIGEEFWNRGIATAAIKEITGYLFENYDLERIYAECFSDNLASQKTLQKSGFSLEAILKRNILKNGVIKDSMIYSIHRS